MKMDRRQISSHYAYYMNLSKLVFIPLEIDRAE